MNEQVDEAVNIVLREIDLQECQALWVLQSYTENLHVHAAVNRISPKSYREIKPSGWWTKEVLEWQANREAAKILDTAETWINIHEELGAKGYDLERRGNGATLK